MRHFVCAAVLAGLITVPLSAGPCVSTLLAVYIASGSGGCTLGAFTVKDFGFTVLASGGGATPTNAVNIMVTPLTTPSGYGFQFNSQGFSVTGAQSVEYLIEYFWDPGPIRSMEDVLMAESPVAPGTATVTTTGCLDAPFIAANCGTSIASVTVFHFGAANTHLVDAVSFPEVQIMGVRHVIDLEANGAVSNITGFGSSIESVPEPAWLLPGGLLLLGALFRLRADLTRPTRG